MKYSQAYGKKRLGTGFYIAAALCLMFIGGTAWFALSKSTEKPDYDISSQQSEYNGNSSAYNEDILPEESGTLPNTDVTQSVSDEPYSSEETAEEQSQVISFAMPVQGEILKSFDSTRLQYSTTYGDMRIHTGVDIACEKGTSVSACSDGTVASIEANTSFGSTVTVEHKNGITVKYSSIDNLNVKQGSTVKTGDILGTAGTVTCECNDKSHIHIEVFKDGVCSDPLKTLGLE